MNVSTNMDVTGVQQSQVVEKSPDVLKVLDNQETKTDSNQTLSVEDVEEMVDSLRDLTETLQTKLNFSVNEGTNDIVVKVIERGTDKIIRQIPSEEMLQLMEKMQDFSGFLLNDNI